MPNQIVELNETGLAIHKTRGFLSVRNGDGEVGRVVLDDIGAVLVSSPNLMWSNTALAELAQRHVPVMTLGGNFNPVSVMLPLIGHHIQANRFRAQADAPLPFRKRAWAQLVKQKIIAQDAVAQRIGTPSARLVRLANSVKSGDPDNHEAQSAQEYWPLVMGKQFRRDRHATGANALLNYGYAVLRAATARALVAAGLHPSLALHHRSGGDALALADDLMEPFRPTVDMAVRHLTTQGIDEVEEARETLVGCLSMEFETDEGMSPLTHILLRLARSLAKSYLDGKPKLDFPSQPIAYMSRV